MYKLEDIATLQPGEEICGSNGDFDWVIALVPAHDGILQRYETTIRDLEEWGKATGNYSIGYTYTLAQVENDARCHIFRNGETQ